MKIQEMAFKILLENKNNLGILLVFILSMIYLIGTGKNHPWLLVSLILIGTLLVLILTHKLPQIVLWYGLLAIFTIDLALNYFLKANHHFLLVYIILLIIFYLKNGSREAFVDNIKWIIIIVLLFSSIQKLITPQFITGDFYYYMFNTGKFFKPVLYFYPELKEITKSNNFQITQLEHTNPNTLKAVKLQNIVPYLEVISRVFAWLTIALELAIALCFIGKPKHHITHLLFILLILGIFITRLENGFLTLLSICGIWLSEHQAIRRVYVILAIGFMLLLIGNIGLF